MSVTVRWKMEEMAVLHSFVAFDGMLQVVSIQVVKESPLLSPLLLGLFLEEVGCGGWKDYLGWSGEDGIHIIPYGMQYINTECVE